MQIQQRINAFEKLGKFLHSFGNEPNPQQSEILYKAKAYNGWFIEENILFALKSWSAALSEENLETWTTPYVFTEDYVSKQVAIIMAGNIPLVGFHDFLSVLISGHKVIVKLSKNDKWLLPYISEKLIEIEPAFKDSITFTEERLTHFDAVIATGSNNTARYFEYYFGKVPNIIRKNRNSVAIITGDESKEEMEALADDVFRYFGLGCRNVSKIYLPENYNMDHFFNGMFSWKDLINNDKYINNYDYNKAVYLMSMLDLLDNEFMLLKEDTGFSSPISVVFYERYSSLEQLKKHLANQKEHIQCISSNCGVENEVSFGKAQKPELWEYADGVDTLSFLLNL